MLIACPYILDRSLKQWGSRSRYYDIYIAELRESPVFRVETLLLSVLALSCAFMFFYLVLELLQAGWGSLTRPYKIRSGYHACDPYPSRWTIFMGATPWGRRFRSDTMLSRGARGGTAILCLFAMLSLLSYLTVVRPSYVPTSDSSSFIQNSRMDVDARGNYDIESLYLSIPDVDSSSSEHLKLTTKIHDLVYISFPPWDCGSNITCTVMDSSSLRISCPLPYDPEDHLWVSNLFQENHIMITLNFTGLVVRFQEQSPVPLEVFLYLGETDDFGGDLATVAEPVILSPGTHLRGYPVLTGHGRVSNTAAAAMGFLKYRNFYATHFRSLTPDPYNFSTSYYSQLNSCNFSGKESTTATIRTRLPDDVTPQAHKEQDSYGNTIWSGFALLGGVWTFVSGFYAAIFGSTLLLVLFGIKPLSVYGLIHAFSGRRVSLVEGNHGISAEEQARTIALLQEHLMDVNSDEPVQDTRVTDELREHELSSPLMHDARSLV
ncbi:hypothetical protein D9756_011422 [Leucocoprinus leucothites]|uniref:Uncharacterized protein n=1 Tax=Leucocoprinus leucothites TaxID=201217 RepID=A0A8H5CNS8_9AGAR|nr:hypothetical protein D9756_011422 [Leucoagaricus leucothites]